MEVRLGVDLAVTSAMGGAESEFPTLLPTLVNQEQGLYGEPRSRNLAMHR